MPEEVITLDDVASSVATLATAVTEMRAGLIDQATVERVAGEVLERQQAHGREQQQRNGYQPEELAGDRAEERLRSATPAERIAQIHARDAKKVSALVRNSESDIRHFQEKADQLVILSAALKVNPRSTKFYAEEYVPALRAIDTATTAEGTEWVPRDLSSALIERVNLDLMVAALFPQVVMPTQPFDIPAKSVSRQRLGKAAEQTADTGQTGFKIVTPGTRKVTLTAVKFAGEALTSKEAEEDAIVAILPFLQEELLEYLGADIEDALVNGDTTGTHMDSDTTSSDDPRKVWNGLRKLALTAAKTDGANADLTTAMLLVNRKKMGKYGTRTGPLAHIVSMAGYVALLADTSVQTLDKYGVAATILTGELGKAHGVPIVVSEYVRQDMNATGVYDGTTTNRSAALTVNKNSYVMGERRGMTVQVLRELYAEYDQDAIIATVRKAFAARFTAATEATVAETYNVKT